MLRKTALALLICLSAAGAHAADDAEAAWAALLSHDAGRGTVVWLQAPPGKVLALYRPQRGDRRRGTVILLHDMGQHPDWPRVVAPLRDGLPDHGWATLSVQMPVLAPDRAPAAYAPLFAQVAPRIQAALAYLKDRQPGTVVLAGYGLGAAMAAQFVGSGGAGDVKALIAVSMLGVDGQTPPLDAAALLGKVKIPVLDIYGSRDLIQVVQRAPDRAQAGSAAAAPAKSYQQVQLTGADHDFTGMTDTLIGWISGWLDRLGGSDNGE